MHRSHVCRRDYEVLLVFLRALAILGLAGIALWSLSAATAAHAMTLY